MPRLSLRTLRISALLAPTHKNSVCHRNFLNGQVFNRNGFILRSSLAIW
jgi:hypothetical protein